MADCTGTTTRGAPCKAPALKGTTRCRAHPLDPASPRFGSHAQAREAGLLGGRPRNPRPHEVMRDLIERNIGALLEPYFKVLGYDVVDAGEEGLKLAPSLGGGAKLYASFEGDVVVSGHDDLGAMQAAAERLLDRVYGKPKQQTELTGAEGGPVDVRQTLDLQRLDAADLAQLEVLLERAAASDAAEPR